MLTFTEAPSGRLSPRSPKVNKVTNLGHRPSQTPRRNHHARRLGVSKPLIFRNLGRGDLEFSNRVEFSVVEERVGGLGLPQRGGGQFMTRRGSAQSHWRITVVIVQRAAARWMLLQTHNTSQRHTTDTTGFYRYTTDTQRDPSDTRSESTDTKLTRSVILLTHDVSDPPDTTQPSPALPSRRRGSDLHRCGAVRSLQLRQHDRSSAPVPGPVMTPYDVSR